MGGMICCSDKFLKRDVKFDEEDNIDINGNQTYIIENNQNQKSRKSLLVYRNENKKQIEKIKSRNVNVKKKTEESLEPKATADFNVENGNFETFAKFRDFEKRNTNGEEDLSTFLNHNYGDEITVKKVKMFDKENGISLTKSKSAPHHQANRKNHYNEQKELNVYIREESGEDFLHKKPDKEKEEPTNLNKPLNKRENMNINDISKIIELDNEEQSELLEKLNNTNINNNTMIPINNTYRENSSLKNDLQIMENECKFPPTNNKNEDEKNKILKIKIKNDCDVKVNDDNYFKLTEENGKNRKIEEMKNKRKHVKNEQPISVEKIEEGKEVDKINKIKDLKINKKSENINSKQNKKTPRKDKNLEGKNLKRRFYLKIFVDYLEIKKNLISEFGIYFKPKLEMQFSDKEIFLFKMNESSSNNLNNSVYLLNTIDPNNLALSPEEFSNVDCRFINAQNSAYNEERVGYKRYTFKETKSIRIGEEIFWDFLHIKLINDSNEKDRMSIISGESYIFIQNLKNIQKPFEGYLNLTTRDEKTVGYLKVSIEKSNEKFELEEESNNNPFASKNLIIRGSEKNDLESSRERNKIRSKSLNIFLKSPKTLNKSSNLESHTNTNYNFKPIFKKEIIHYSDLDLKSLKDLFDYDNELSVKLFQNQKEEIDFEKFLSKYKDKLQSYIKSTEIIMNLDSKNLNDALKNKYLKIPINLEEESSEIFFYKYALVLFEFINILLALVEKNLVFELNKFFLIIETEIVLFFYNIPLLFPENVLLVKNYFQFVFKYRSIVKNSSDLIIRNEFTLDDYLIIRNVYEYFYILNYMNKNNVESLENKFIFDENHQIKIDENLSIKYKKNKSGINDNNTNKTIKKLKDTTRKLADNPKLKSDRGAMISKSNLIKWASRQCLIKGVNLLNNSITLPNELMLFEDDPSLRNNIDQSLQLDSEEIFLYNQEIQAENIKEQNIIYTNSIDIMSNYFFLIKIMNFDFIREDSLILNSIMRLFRKNIQLLTNEYLTNIQYKNKLIDLKEFSITFKHSMLSKDDTCFILFLRILIPKLSHYPDFFNNVLIILIQMTSEIDKNSLLMVASEINLEELKTHFHFYRAKISSSFSKMININYLSLLANLLEISNFNSERIVIPNKGPNDYEKMKIEEFDILNKKKEEILFAINMDFKLFYNRDLSNKIAKQTLVYKSFKNKKQIFIEVHEIITRIGYCLTKNIEFAFSLLQSNFYSDIIDYLFYLAHTPNLIEKITNKIQNKKDSLVYKNLLTSIIENSICIIINGFNCLLIDENFSMKDILQGCKISSNDELFTLIEKCILVLEENQCSIEKSVENYELCLSLFMVK